MEFGRRRGFWGPTASPIALRISRLAPSVGCASSRRFFHYFKDANRSRLRRASIARKELKNLKKNPQQGALSRYFPRLSRVQARPRLCSSTNLAPNHRPKSFDATGIAPKIQARHPPASELRCAL